MIGLDTNILLRLWVDDDPAQGRRVEALLSEHGKTPGSLLVTDVVLVEALWTLRTAYGQDKATELLVLRSMLDEAAFAFEDRDAVAAAVDLFGTQTCGFSDCLVAVKHAAHRCDFTATFDRGMRQLPGVRLI